MNSMLNGLSVWIAQNMELNNPSTITKVEKEGGKTQAPTLVAANVQSSITMVLDAKTMDRLGLRSAYEMYYLFTPGNTLVEKGYIWTKAGRSYNVKYVEDHPVDDPVYKMVCLERVTTK
jgi:hypothetical protein